MYCVCTYTLPRHYDLSVLYMSAMGFQKMFWIGARRVG